MNSFNKTEAAVFSFRPCFLKASLFSVEIFHCSDNPNEISLASFNFCIPVFVSKTAAAAAAATTITTTTSTKTTTNPHSFYIHVLYLSILFKFVLIQKSDLVTVLI